MSRVEIGSDQHRVTIEHEQVSANELADIAQKIYLATCPDRTPRTTIGPTAHPYMEKASGPEYASAHQIDM